MLRPAWFSLGVEFSPDEHLRRIPPLPYPTPVIFTPATLGTLDLWTIYFPQNNEVFVILVIKNDLLFLSKISRDSHHQVNH